MNKICITNQQSGLALPSNRPRQVNFLEVWGDTPSSNPPIRSLESVMQTCPAIETDTQQTNKFKSLLRSLFSLLG